MDNEWRNDNTASRKPVELDKEYEIEITDKSQLGDGVARMQSFVVLVRNGKIGGKVRLGQRS